MNVCKILRPSLDPPRYCRTLPLVQIDLPLRVHRGSFPAVVFYEALNDFSTNVPYWAGVLRVGCVLSQVKAASGDLSF